MSLVIHRKPLSSNYDPVEINVEFLIIHYTSASLLKTLDIFHNPDSKVSSHLILDYDGAVYELVPCLKGKCFKAWHAGDSRWQGEGKNWRGFNDFSIGVELVNRNGNLFKYTKEQYYALQSVLTQLKAYYTALKEPDRVLGHEHIAGYRGKVDPGHCFDWPLFFQMNYDAPAPLRKAALPEKQRKIFADISNNFLKSAEAQTDEDWMQLNSRMEKSISSFSS